MSNNLQDDSEFGRPRPKAGPRKGPYFIEVLLVIVIIVVLIGLCMPAIRTARPAARRVQCSNNLKQIALALQNYEQQYNVLPPAYTVDAQGRRLHGWRTLLLPFLEQGPLYETIDLTKPWDDPVNARALATTLSVYQCPESPEPSNKTTYLAIRAPQSVLSSDRPRTKDEITDDHAKTLMIVEVGPENAVPWMASIDADEPLFLRLGSTTKTSHVGGMHECRLDGSVRFLKETTPENVRRALISVAGGDDAVLKDW